MMNHLAMSKIPTILIPQLASKNVKFCLSGDGGTNSLEVIIGIFGLI